MSFKNNTIEYNFKKSFYWSLSGCIVYELVKTVHNFFLINFLSIQEYGLIGSILSIIYLSVKISDIGTTHALPPFFHLLQKSKFFFTKIFINYFLLPQLPAIGITALVVSITCLFKFSFNNLITIIWVLPTLILLETLRSFFRYFLHFAFRSNLVVIYELGSFLGYIGIIWTSLLLLPQLSGLQVILVAHLIDSLFIVSIFTYLIVKYYKALPIVQNAQMSPTIKTRINNMRVFNYLLRISRELFTNSFLTPLFALKFGLPNVGLFFFVGSLATSVQSVIKSVISYSGTALLANSKEETIENKKKVFQLLCQKLFFIIGPGLLLLLANMRVIIKISHSYTTTSFALGSLLLFSCLLFIEFFFMLYEQFYIMEESTKHLFSVKLLEFLLLYVVIDTGTNSPMLKMFAWIVAVRFISFVIIMINAYYRWKIRPSIRISRPNKYIFVLTSILLILSLLLERFLS